MHEFMPFARAGIIHKFYTP